MQPENEFMKDLTAALENMVAARRKLAKSLSGKYEAVQFDGWTKKFIETQNTIDALNRALSEEQAADRVAPAIEGGTSENAFGFDKA